MKTSETIYHPNIRVVVILCSGFCKIDYLVKLRSKKENCPQKDFDTLLKVQEPHVRVEILLTTYLIRP